MGGRGSSSKSSGAAAASSQLAKPLHMQIRDIAADATMSDKDKNAAIIAALTADGFTVSGTFETFDTEVFAAMTGKISELEDQYGAFQMFGEGMEIREIQNKNAWGGMNYHGVLSISTLSEKADFRHNNLIWEQDTGYKVMTDDRSRATTLSYTAYHEYGHLIADLICMKQTGASDGFQTLMNIDDWARGARSDVLKIAKKKYGYTGGVKGIEKTLSRYATYKKKGQGPREFFSEAFVAYNLSKDNPIGKAYGDWLQQNY